MNIPLQDWAVDNNSDDTDLIYRNGFWDQIIFVRDKIHGIIFSHYKRNNKGDMGKIDIRVISQHMSKSVLLPVFHITIPDGTKVVMRYNFYDWKVSVKSPVNIEIDQFERLFDTKNTISSIYCDGFPDKWVFGPYSKNKKKFTFEVYDDLMLYTFFWIFLNHTTRPQ